jgi:hypothetical protein
MLYNRRRGHRDLQSCLQMSTGTKQTSSYFLTKTVPQQEMRRVSARALEIVCSRQMVFFMSSTL